MVMMTPGVDQLALHLPKEQTVFYEPLQKSADDAVKSKEATQLTKYFRKNVNFPQSALSIKYEDFPITFVWNLRKKLWTAWERTTVEHMT